MSITEGTETLDEGEKEAFAALLLGDTNQWQADKSASGQGENHETYCHREFRYKSLRETPRRTPLSEGRSSRDIFSAMTLL